MTIEKLTDKQLLVRFKILLEFFTTRKTLLYLLFRYQLFSNSKRPWNWFNKYSQEWN